MLVNKLVTFLLWGTHISQVYGAQGRLGSCQLHYREVNLSDSGHLDAFPYTQLCGKTDKQFGEEVEQLEQLEKYVSDHGHELDACELKQIHKELDQIKMSQEQLTQCEYIKNYIKELEMELDTWHAVSTVSLLAVVGFFVRRVWFFVRRT